MKLLHNWGILGAGQMARKFVSDLKFLPQARVHAIGSRSRERAISFAGQHGIDKAYGSYEELVSDPEIDVVYIASRHIGHYPDSILCLNHGKHVLCEKPSAMNRAQLERVIAAARESGCFYMEALWTRFLPSFISCLEHVRQGEIGQIRAIESDFCINIPYDSNHRVYNPAYGGGSLLDVGIYPVFCALEIGTPVTGISTTAALDRNGIDTSCSVLLNHSGGELSILFSSLNCPGRTESLIHGSRGMLRLHKWWHCPTRLEHISETGESRVFPCTEAGYGYQYEAAEVMRRIDAGAVQSELWPWEKSLALIDLLDRIRELAGIRYPSEVESL